MSDSYLFDIGWMFFAAWSIVVFVVGVAAFGKDLFPQRKSAASPRNLVPAKTTAARPNLR